MLRPQNPLGLTGHNHSGYLELKRPDGFTKKMILKKPISITPLMHINTFKSCLRSNFTLLSLVIICTSFTPKLFAQQIITYEASTALFANPERGFYHYIETRASQPEAYDVNELRAFRQSEDITLLYCINYLDTFVNSAISTSFLDHFETNMDLVRNAGLKCVLRFAYTDDDPTTRNEEPPFGDANMEQILAHIDQLGPLLAKHADVIATMQAGFIGVWGEWYYTDHFVDNPANPDEISPAQHVRRLQVVKALMEYLPETHQVAVRYPHAKQGMLSRELPITEGEAFADDELARIGFHNDCFLAGEQDFGTYLDGTDRTYLAEETHFVGLGGETCQNNPPRSSCQNALDELSDYHWTYLNTEYHPAVVSGWEQGGCVDEIKRRLGYRLALKEATFPVSVNSGDSFLMQIDIENTGWSAPIKNRPTMLIAAHNQTGSRYRAMLPAEMRLWRPGTTQRLEAEICTPQSLPAGGYALSLYMPDAMMADVMPERNGSSYALRFANQGGLWDEVTGFNGLAHTMQVETGAGACTGPIVLEPDEIATSIQEPEVEYGSFDWTVYPNPAKQTIRVTLRGMRSGVTRVEIFDILGRSVRSTQLTGSAAAGIMNQEIQVDDLLAGIYALRISTAAGVSTKLFSVIQ